jgi:dihydrofolate reductase
MRTVTYGAAVSLDGYLARTDGSIDWLHFSKDAQDVMGKYWPTVDTIVFGRKTFEVAMKSGGGGGGGGDGGIATYVCSRTLTELSAPGAELVREDAGEFVAKLKRQKGKGICVMSGGNLAASLFAVGTIDEIGLNIHPILLGAGVPMFAGPARDVKLELTECRRIEGGCVLVNYRVLRARS